jgi:hypothetical protein
MLGPASCGSGDLRKFQADEKGINVKTADTFSSGYS